MNLNFFLTELTTALSEHAVLLLFFILAIGTAIGSIKIKGFGLGPAAVLFFALGLSALNPELKLPEAVGTFGLVLFAYTIGVSSGPSFFNALRHGGPILSVVTVPQNSMI